MASRRFFDNIKPLRKGLHPNMADNLDETGGIRVFWLSPKIQFFKPEIFAATALFALLLFLSAYPKTSVSFLSAENFLNVTRQVSMNAIIACGMTFAILMGGIDLSVGSVVAVSGMIAGDCMMRMGLPVPAAIIIAIIGGSLFGAFNGAVAAFTNVPPFIATLGTMSIGRGLSLLFRAGYAISDLPESFNRIGQGALFSIPYATIIIGTIIGALLLGFLGNGLNLMGVSPYLQIIFKGFVILVAVFARSGWSEKR